jgi:hypothetical protein
MSWKMQKTRFKGGFFASSAGDRPGFSGSQVLFRMRATRSA